MYPLSMIVAQTEPDEASIFLHAIDEMSIECKCQQILAVGNEMPDNIPNEDLENLEFIFV